MNTTSMIQCPDATSSIKHSTTPCTHTHTHTHTHTYTHICAIPVYIYYVYLYSMLSCYAIQLSASYATLCYSCRSSTQQIPVRSINVSYIIRKHSAPSGSFSFSLSLSFSFSLSLYFSLTLCPRLSLSLSVFFSRFPL